MTTRHEQILLGLQSLLASDPFFPPPQLDAPEPRWPTQPAGVKAALLEFVSVQDGEIEVTRDGGAENSWELELKAKIAYAVQGADARGRRARRDEAAEHIAALIRGCRDLGLQDPQVYAEIEDVERDDEVPVKGAAPTALLVVDLAIQFIASSPAG